MVIFLFLSPLVSFCTVIYRKLRFEDETTQSFPILELFMLQLHVGYYCCVICKVREKARSRKTRGDSRILEKIAGFPFCTENRAIGLFWSAITSNMH